MVRPIWSQFLKPIYSVRIVIRVTLSTLLKVVSLLDTGAGPSAVNKDSLLPTWKVSIKFFK